MYLLGPSEGTGAARPEETERNKARRVIVTECMIGANGLIELGIS
jgi:hypothetical protein